MKCDEIRELLSLYIDQMLDDNQRSDVEKHLSGCEACQKEYDELNEIHILLNEMEPVPVPDVFELRLKQALKEEKKRMNGFGGPIRSLFTNKQYRMLASVAAVFAVGILTLGVYQDVLGDFADKLNFVRQDGTEQAAPRDAEVDLYGAGSGMDADSGNDVDYDDMNNKLDQLDDQVQMSTESNDPEMKYRADTKENGSASSMQKNAPVKKESVTVPERAAGNAGGSENAPSSDGANFGAGGAAVSDGDEAADENAKEKEITYGALAQDESRAKSKAGLTGEACSRSLTASGVERNTAAVQYYMNLIEERLVGFDYQVLNSGYAQTGTWNFKIFIFRGKDGNTYNEEILIIGKDGKIEVICSNEITGL